MSGPAYPFDPDVLERVASALYQLMPALYRIRDEGAAGSGDLRAFLRVLAAPLAEVRQNIEELHGDLFVDSCHDWVLPYLAQMVGTDLLFPEPAANRRDLRSLVARRRRKGTVSALDELGRELLGQTVTTLEGWQRLVTLQDLQLQRPERTVPDLTMPMVAETASGPLDRTLRTVDVRQIGPDSGRYHPRHLTHYLCASTLFRLHGGMPCSRERLPSTFDPLGRSLQLRTRNTTGGYSTDRVWPLHFAADPAAFFNQEAEPDDRICVRIDGLPAAVAEPVPMQRNASSKPWRAQGETEPILLSGSVGSNFWVTVVNSESGHVMVLVRATTPGRFPGATYLVERIATDAGLACEEEPLAREGFLRGALVCTLPAVWIEAERQFYLAQDGSVYASSLAGEGPATALPLTVGPGPAWPPLGQSLRTDRMVLTEIPQRCDARFLHGSRVLIASEDRSFAEPTEQTNVAVVFAARVQRRDRDLFLPFLRIDWACERHLRRVVSRLQTAGSLDSIADVAVRFEASEMNAVLPPCEISFRDARGVPTLLHLPELPTRADQPILTWPVGRETRFASAAVIAGVDGSTRWLVGDDPARVALGCVAPLPGRFALVRRELRVRQLSEAAQDDAVRALDIDPMSGTFRVSAADGDTISVDCLEAFGGDVGAWPQAREPILGAKLPTPTRIVSARGFSASCEQANPQVPRYTSLAAAFADIDDAHAHEIVQFDDSATYEESLRWPKNCDWLTLQAAELERPVLRLTQRPEGSLPRLSLTGLSLTAPLLRSVHKLELRLCTLLEGDLVVPDGTRVEIDRCILGALRLEGEGVLRMHDSLVDVPGSGIAIDAAQASCALERVTVLTDAGAQNLECLHLEASEVVFTGSLVVHDRFHGYIRYSRLPSQSDDKLPRLHHITTDAPRFVTSERLGPTRARLAVDCPASIVRGAEDGGEMGVFHGTRLSQRSTALARRLAEFTPAGFDSGIVRLD